MLLNLKFKLKGLDILKRLLPLIFTFVLLCACQKPTTIKLENRPFDSDVDISFGGSKNSYILKYSSKGNCRFSSTSEVPVDFCWQSGICTLDCFDTEFYAATDIDKTPVGIIKVAIEDAMEKPVAPNKAGEYILHGITSRGDYTLKLSPDGKLQQITFDNTQISANFSEVSS